MPDSAHSISVVVTPRGRRRLLAWSVESALAQEDASVEVLVAGRVAGTPLPDDPRIRILGLDPGVTPAAARNTALRAAGGDWVGFLDEGDWWAPHRVRRQLADAAAADAAIAYAGRVAIDRSGGLVTYVLPEEPDGLARRLRVSDALGAACCVLLRAQAVRAVGGFDERLRVLHEWRLWIDLLDHGHASACPDLLVAEMRAGPPMQLRAPRRTMQELRALAREGHIDPETPARAAVDLAHALRQLGHRRQAAACYLVNAVEQARPQDAVRATAAALRRPGLAPPAEFVRPSWLPSPPRNP